MTPLKLSELEIGNRVTVSIVSEPKNRFNKGRGRGANILWDRLTIPQTLAGNVAGAGDYKKAMSRLVTKKLGLATDYVPSERNWKKINGVSYKADTAGNGAQLIVLRYTSSIKKEIFVDGRPATEAELEYLKGFRKPFPKEKVL